MSVFQVVAILFALFMLYVVNIHRRKLRLTRLEVFFWYSAWILFMVIAIMPDLLTGIAGTLKFARVFDLLVVVALMVITVVVMSNYFMQRENTKKLEQVVRDIAVTKTKLTFQKKKT